MLYVHRLGKDITILPIVAAVFPLFVLVKMKNMCSFVQEVIL